jgi:hypothetical protein
VVDSTGGVVSVTSSIRASDNADNIFPSLICCFTDAISFCFFKIDLNKKEQFKIQKS